MRNVSIKTATDDQLKMFVSAGLGLNIPNGASRQEVIALLGNRTEISVPDKKTPTDLHTQPQEDAPRVSATEDQTQKRFYRIIVSKQPGVGGTRDVPVSVNGVTMLVPRGISCEIPEKYFGVLRDAIETEYEPDKDGHPVGNDVQRYPVTVIEGPYIKSQKDG